MNRLLNRPVASLWLTTALCLSVGQTFAENSTKSVTFIEGEGAGNCNDYSLNSVLQISSNKVAQQSGTQLTGPDGPDEDTEAETATFFLEGGSKLSWQASAPVSYVVLSGTGKHVKVFYYPKEGVLSDSNLSLIDDSITGISICYGFSAQAAADQLAPLPICGNSPNTGGREYDKDDNLLYAGNRLDSTVITCPKCTDWNSADLPQALKAELLINCVEGCTDVCEVDENGFPDMDTCNCVPPPISLVINLEEKEDQAGINDGEWACHCNLQPSRNTACRTDVPDSDPTSCAAGGGIFTKTLDNFGVLQHNPPGVWRNGICYGC